MYSLLGICMFVYSRAGTLTGFLQVQLKVKKQLLESYLHSAPYFRMSYFDRLGYLDLEKQQYDSYKKAAGAKVRALHARKHAYARLECLCSRIEGML